MTEIVHYRNVCQAPGCDRGAVNKYMPGHCAMHKARLREHGSLELPPRPPKAPKPPCAVEGCTRPHCSRGMCSMHLQRQNKYGDPGEAATRHGRPKPPCAVEGCDQPLAWGDMCMMHMQRQRKYGDPGEVGRRRPGWAVKPKPPCSVDGCDRLAKQVSGPVAGLCEPHSDRFRRNGDVGSPLIRSCVQLHQVTPAADRTCTVVGCDRLRYHSRLYCNLHRGRVYTYGTTELPQVDRTCVAPGCERTDREARGYCGMHYKRVLKYGTTELPQVDRTCIVPGCERTDPRSYGHCALHYERVRKYGDPLVVRGGAGEKNPGWIGDAASYEVAHRRIRASRGSASAVTCANCEGPAQEWAYTGQGGDAERIDHRGLRYSLDIADYEPMCKLCHRRRDARPLLAVRNRVGHNPYLYMHGRVRRARGRPSTHPCVDCGEQAQEWAYNNAGGESDRVANLVQGGGVYAVHFSVDPADYDPMCKRCHRHRDALYRAQRAWERRP